MRACYFDAFSGISGDMTVGALLDAGADAGALTDALRSMNTGASFTIEKTKRRGITATKFRVEGGEQKAHRHLPQILRMIDAGNLPGRAREQAKAVFQRLAEAEAAVHGVALEKVHFHEVGAVDSICDIVGACTALALLGIEEVYCSPLNVGSGTVQTEHGMLPVPAPATATLLKDRPIYARGPEMELTTPTGAAFVTTLAKRFGSLPAMSLAASGHGAGDRDFPSQANVLRVLIGETKAVAESTSVTVIEANLDDATPQMLGYAMERLLEAGALDVAFSPLQMKKNRPGTLLMVMAKPDDQERLVQLLFAETTTLGVRLSQAERRVQARETVEVFTPHGRVRVKTGDSGVFTPEFEDVRAIARETGLPMRDVLAATNLAFQEQMSLRDRA